MKLSPLLLIPPIAILLSSCVTEDDRPVYGGPGYSGREDVYVQGDDHHNYDHDRDHRDVTDTNQVDVNRTTVNDRTVNRTTVNDRTVNQSTGNRPSTAAVKGKSHKHFSKVRPSPNH
jgi:hypothetical protein